MVAHLNMFMICALKITQLFHSTCWRYYYLVSVCWLCAQRGAVYTKLSATQVKTDNWPHDGAIVPSYCKYRVWLWTGKRWREKRYFKVPNVNQLESRSWREWRKQVKCQEWHCKRKPEQETDINKELRALLTSLCNTNSTHNTLLSGSSIYWSLLCLKILFEFGFKRSVLVILSEPNNF